MAVEFTQEVSSRLASDHYGWLTTVAKSGQPVPRLVWFYFDGKDVIVYPIPNAAKVRHIRNHPRVSLNLDSDGNGAGVIVVGGEARVDAEDGADPSRTSHIGPSTASSRPASGFTEEFLPPTDPAEDQRRQGVDHADRGLTIVTGSRGTSTPPRMSSLPIRSATTVTAPVAFCT